MFIERNMIDSNNLSYYHSYKYHSVDYLHRLERMHGIKRIVIFCTLIMVLPTMLLVVPLYLRHSIYADVQFAVTESDIVEITDGISPIFCSEHKLKMNESFNAFQVSGKPEKTSYRKHIRLKKSMTLPDDTLEYWGFYLLKGSTVALSVCSRFEGSSILVVKGERNLRTCGLLDHNKNKAKAPGIFLPQANQQVKVTFESKAQEINSNELNTTTNKISHQDNCFNCTNKKLKNNNKINKAALDLNINLTKIINMNKLENVSIEERKSSNLLNMTDENLNNYESFKFETSTDKPRHLKRKLRMLDNEYNKETDNIKNNENFTKLSMNRKNLKVRKKMNEKYNKRMKLLHHELGLDIEDTKIEDDDHAKEQITGNIKMRQKRSQQPIKPEILDQGIRHGGNAVKNFTDNDSSVSSFENGLLHCYGGNVLLTHEFEPSDECTNVNYLLNGNKHVQTIHEVAEDGYYYYIFYSDNDIVSNDIHAVFEIYKPTLLYENVTRACINQTQCNFHLPISSVDRVIVEVPTKDGIDHEINDISVLVSTCVPRMGIYAIFPITVLFLVLGCAFM